MATEKIYKNASWDLISVGEPIRGTQLATTAAANTVVMLSEITGLSRNAFYDVKAYISLHITAAKSDALTVCAVDADNSAYNSYENNVGQTIHAPYVSDQQMCVCGTITGATKMKMQCYSNVALSNISIKFVITKIK